MGQAASSSVAGWGAAPSGGSASLISSPGEVSDNATGDNGFDRCSSGLDENIHGDGSLQGVGAGTGLAPSLDSASLSSITQGDYPEDHWGEAVAIPRTATIIWAHCGIPPVGPARSARQSMSEGRNEDDANDARIQGSSGGRHLYERTEISGHATVRQGDSHNEQHYNFPAAKTIQIFACEKDIDLERFTFVLGQKHARDVCDVGDQCDCSAKRIKSSVVTSELDCFQSRERGQTIPNTGNTVDLEQSTKPATFYIRAQTRRESSREETGTHIINKILQSVEAGQGLVSLPSSKDVEQELRSAETLQCLKLNLASSNQRRRGFFITLIDKLRQNTYFQAIADILPRT